MAADHVEIRVARLSDVSSLSDVFRRSSLSNEGDRASLLAHPDALVFSDESVREGRTRVAIVGSTIVGFASLAFGGPAAELDDLFVDPEWMQRGIGRMLVDDAVGVARMRGASRIEVTANAHALDFYENVGFIRDGLVETRFGAGTRMHLDCEP
jgi:ribosomal protein S18 acetylase RimI-like enzyme